MKNSIMLQLVLEWVNWRLLEKILSSEWDAHDLMLGDKQSHMSGEELEGPDERLGHREAEGASYCLLEKLPISKIVHKNDSFSNASYCCMFRNIG